MSIKRLIFSIFPPPRVPLTIRQSLPLLLFLLLYVGLCVFLEMADVLLFARPWRFAFMAVAPWVWWMHVAGYSGLVKFRGLLALSVRLALVGAFVMLLAEPRAVRSRDTLSVVYAVDISDSIGERSTDAALTFVASTVHDKPEKDEAGLIVFGRNASVELPPRMSFPVEGDNIALNTRIDPDATNLEQALSLSAAMLPEENPGRIVLISDGSHTEGSLSRILDELKSREIRVDVLPIQYDYEQEVWLERLELPRFVKIGENYDAGIILASLRSGRGNLVLRENNEMISEQTVDFQPGKNRYTVPIKLREPGYYEYSATIELPRDADHLFKNNTVLNYIFVEGEGKVLIVTDPEGDDRDWKSMSKAIREGKRLVEVQVAYDFPHDALSLMPYDTVIFANVPADAFDVVQLKAMRDAVFDLGIGFVMVGGPNSFGPGGYHRTTIEEALPVTMDVTKKKILPKGALVIILHTCEFPEGNTWGKRITKQAVKVLGAKDEVGVLVYDWEGGEKWLFELTPAGDYAKLVPKINAAQIGDMPSFSATMKEGLKALKESDAAAKHMIIISDGDPSPPPPPLIQDFLDSKVSVSMVAVFPHGGMDISKMQAIANITGGRYYKPSDPNQLPSIFIKESKTLKRSMIQNKTIAPEFGFPSAIMRGIDSLPKLHGYVLTTAKGRAKVILKAPVKEEDQIDPVLATWRYGLGTTAAFTSDLSTNWGKDWVEWDKYKAFVGQLLIDVSRVRKQGHLRMWSFTSGSQGVILVEDFHPDDSFLEIGARITGPRDRSETIALKQIGPRRYKGTVPLWGRGRYQVMAAPVGGNRTDDRAHGGFIVPYSPEYLRFRSNPIVLKEIAKKTGGQVLKKDSKAKDIFQTGRKPKQSSRPVFDWFLMALAILMPFDVAVRRVQIDLYAVKRLLGFGRKVGPSTATMGALLKRKQAIDSTLDTQRKESPLPTSVLPRPTVAPKQEPSSLKKPTELRRDQQKPQVEVDVPTSTTSRLLAMKRRRDQEDEEDSQQG